MTPGRTTTLALSLLAAVSLLALFCKKPPVGDPPATPAAPAGVTSGGINTSYDFSATTTDPDNDSVCFRFQWGDGATSDWCNWVASGETATMAHQWATPNTYQVKTQAKDRPGNTSDWSATLAVSITSNRPPNTPAIPTGPSSAPKDSVCFYTSITTDPDGDGVSYRFSWGNGDTSEWGGWTQSGTPGGAMYAYPRSGAFQVRAQARDANEARSGWSSPLSVTITTPAGTLKWRYLTGYYVRSSPAVAADGTVYVGSLDYYLYAINPTGTLKWRYLTGSYVSSSPSVAADGTVYVGSYDNYLYAINSTGTLKWRYLTSGHVDASPAVAADGTVYVGSDDNYLYAIDPTGTLKWRYRTSGEVYSSPAVAADGTVYVGSGDNYLYAINPTGTLKWRYLTGSYASSSPAVAADGTVYVGSGDNYLCAINPTGTLRWHCQTGGQIWSSPAVAAGGTVHVGSDDNYLYAIYGDSPLATDAPWPKFHHDNKNTGRVGGGW